MERGDLVDLSLGQLLELDPEQMWRTVLSTVYGVSSAAKAAYYSKRAKEMGIDLPEQIHSMMHLLPLSAVVEERCNPTTDARDRAKDLAPIMEPGPLRRAQNLARLSSDALGSTFDKRWKGFRSMADFGKEYFSSNAPSAPAEAIAAASLDDKWLVIAHVKGTGLFVGPDVTYKGMTDESGSQRLPGGLVFFGPRVDLRPGTYTLYVDIKLESPGVELHFDVVANGGLNKLLDLRAIGRLSGAIAFEVEEQHKMIEIRCANPSPNNVICDISHIALGSREF